MSLFILSGFKYFFSSDISILIFSISYVTHRKYQSEIAVIAKEDEAINCSRLPSCQSLNAPCPSSLNVPSQKLTTSHLINYIVLLFFPLNQTEFNCMKFTHGIQHKYEYHTSVKWKCIAFQRTSSQITTSIETFFHLSNEDTSPCVCVYWSKMESRQMSLLSISITFQI